MEFAFIDENPLKEDSLLEFGHREIVSTLDNIVKKQKQNLTIGLFGGWGTGKSSIVESLKNKLLDSEIPLVVFDVWKHEGDALRRTFIKSCIEQLGHDPYGEKFLNKNHKLDSRLEAAGQISNERFIFHWPTLWKKLLLALAGITLMFFASVLILAILWIFGINLLEDIKLTGIIALVTAGTTASLFFKYMDSVIKIEKIDIKEERFQDPYQFEEEFTRIIKNLLNPSKKIMITFDNLDRVSGENALNTISTIKTFLDFKSPNDLSHTVIFLIPCDVNSMKRHIAKSLQKNDQNSTEESQYIDEFLRKFFNTSLWIPDFHHVELEGFAAKKLAETKIPEFQNDSLSWLIIKIFNKNPRQIVQFINLLTSNFLLLKEICDTNGLSDKDFYKKNVPQLAKFLLLKQSHPDELEQYRLNNIFHLEPTEEILASQSDGFKILLKQSEHISIANLEPFFKGRMTQDQQDHPALVELLRMMRFDDPTLKDYCRTIDISGNKQIFEHMVKAEVSKIKIQIQRTIFIGHALEMCNKFDISFSGGLYRDIINFLITTNNNTAYSQISPLLIKSELFTKASSLTPSDESKIIDGYINAFFFANSEENDSPIGQSQLVKLRGEIIDFLISIKSRISSKQHTMLRSLIEDNKSSLVLLNGPFVNQDTQDFFISEKFKEEALANVNGISDKDSFIAHLHMIDRFLPLNKFTIPILSTIATSWSQMMSIDNTQETANQYITHREIIQERLAMAMETEQNLIPEELLKKLHKYIEVCNPEELAHWLDEIVLLSKFEQFKTTSQILILHVLRSGKANLINHFIELTGGIEAFIMISNTILQNYANFLTRGQFDELMLAEVPLPALKEVLKNYVNDQRYEEAVTLTAKLRDMIDEGDSDIGTFFGEKVEELSKNNDSYIHIKNVIDLLLLLTDNNAEKLEQIDFWGVMEKLLISSKPPEIDRYAYELLCDHIKKLSDEASSRLFEKLMEMVRSKQLYQQDYLHETIFYILNEKPDTERTKTYLKQSFDIILIKSNNESIILLIDETLRKFDLKIRELSTELQTFLNNIQRLPHLQSKRFWPVVESLKAIIGRDDKLLSSTINSKINAMHQRLVQFNPRNT